MKPVISVIVPVYNVSAFVGRCAESICNQTFKNYEIIFVDDASTDNSVEQIRNTLNCIKSDAFKTTIICQSVNCGVVEARRKGLESATGDYILFVDSDDYIESTMLEHLYSCACNQNADIVTSDMFLEYGSHKEYFKEYLSVNPKNYFEDITFGNYYSHSLCNKLVKKELYLLSYADLKYKMTYYEDKFVCIRLYFYAGTIVKINNAYYHYVKYNNASATQTVSKSTFESVKYYWIELEQFLIRNSLQSTYKEHLNIGKIKDVVKLFFSTSSYKLISEYALLFETDEIEIKNKLRIGERLLLKLVRKKYFTLACIVKQIIILKNKKLLCDRKQSFSD